MLEYVMELPQRNHEVRSLGLVTRLADIVDGGDVAYLKSTARSHENHRHSLRANVTK